MPGCRVPAWVGCGTVAGCDTPSVRRTMSEPLRSRGRASFLSHLGTGPGKASSSAANKGVDSHGRPCRSLFGESGVANAQVVRFRSDLRDMPDQIFLLANMVIAVAYASIMVAIVVPVARAGQLHTYKLASPLP